MAQKTLKKGLFITFEGSEGSGKSTQSEMLTSFLRREGFKVIHIWDPGSTAFGEAIRKILLMPGKDFSAISETMLYIAARAQLVEETIEPALKNKQIVICDRYADATVCYQGYGLGIDIELINKLNKVATKSIMPDITFFLDTDIKEGLNRSLSVKGFADRIERRSYDFYLRVRKGYLALAKEFPQRIVKISIDTNDKEKTQQIIRRTVLDAVKRYQGPAKSD